MYAVSAALIDAVRDYRWLLDRDYPTTASIKLVGDRHRLDKEERLILFRGVASEADSLRRASTLRSDIAGCALAVDAYNQILSVMHYADGRPVFVSSDGFLRDVGASHGRISDRGRFLRAMEILADALAAAAPARVDAWFDAPVSGSAVHAAEFAELLRERGLAANAAVERSADGPLKLVGDRAAVEPDRLTATPPADSAPASAPVATAAPPVAATSDSAVVDALAKSGTPVFDAARYAVESRFGARPWLDLGELLRARS